jgi:hypothetical protein
MGMGRRHGLGYNGWGRGGTGWGRGEKKGGDEREREREWGGGKRGGGGKKRERGTKQICQIASLSSLNSHVFPYAHQMTQISFCIDEKLRKRKQKQALPNFKHSQDEF